MYFPISFKVNFKVFLFVLLNTFFASFLTNYNTFSYQLLNNVSYLVLFYKTYQIPLFLFLRCEV